MNKFTISVCATIQNSMVLLFNKIGRLEKDAKADVCETELSIGGFGCNKKGHYKHIS